MCPQDNPRSALSSDEIASQAVTYHEPTETYRTYFDLHTRPTSEAIITAVATATETDPLKLPLLHLAINSNALDALLETPVHGDSRDITITFEYADCRVSVKDHGTVLVEPDSGDSTN